MLPRQAWERARVRFSEHEEKLGTEQETGEFPTFFPLGLFADSSLPIATTTPITSGMHVFRPPVLALSKVDVHGDTFEWRQCNVIAWDPRRQMYHIQWLDEDVKKWVTVINIRPLDESDKDYLSRVSVAEQTRAEAEAMLRYGMRIRAMLLIRLQHHNLK